MKKQIPLMAMLFACAFLISSIGAFAQNAKMQTKEEFKSHFDEIHNSLAKWKERAESMASTNPDFATEVKQLDDWAHDFWGKLNEWDNVAQDKKEEYKNKMQTHWDQLRAQHEKVQTMWEGIQGPSKVKSEEQMKKDTEVKQKDSEMKQKETETKDKDTDMKQKSTDTKDNDPKTKVSTPK